MVNDQSTNLPFDAVGGPLDTLCIAMANKIRLEWPQKWRDLPEAAVTLNAILKVSENTYKSILYLCAEKPPDPSRKLEYAISAPPLARTILDSVFTVVFLFENFQSHFAWYMKSGWREIYKEHQRYGAAYGSEPKWNDWLQSHASVLTDLERRSGVTAAEKAKPDLIRWFPNPGKMSRIQELSGPTKSYLIYLNDWFYRSLSSSSHLSLPGLMNRSAYLLRFLGRSEDEEERERVLGKFRSDSVVTAIILLVALLSELQIGLEYDLAQRCKFLWTMLAGFFGTADEIYKLRYVALL